MDAITLLSQDHERVLAMLDQLERGPSARTGADAEQLKARKKLVTELVVAESGHEAVEEQYFWPFVRESLLEGETLADEAVGQEAEAKHVLQALDEAEPDGPDFEEMVTEIIAAGRMHIDFEQTEVWPKLQVVVSEEELAELGDRMAAAKKLAPTRPHPGTPADPAVQKTAGAASAVADKVRDTITGRNKN